MGVFLSPSFLASVGVILSCYALYVEHKVHHLKDGEEFTAMCDIDAIKASCSAVFQRPEGHMLSYFGLVGQDSIFNVPNAALGLLYYTYQLLLRNFMPYPLTLFATCAAMASSIFLAYTLLLIRELCVLCLTTHVLNTLLLYYTWVELPKTLEGLSGSSNIMKTRVGKLKES